MNSMNIRDMYDGLEEIIGRDLTGLLRTGSITTTLALKIIKEDFTLEKMEGTITELEHYIQLNTSPSEGDDLLSSLEGENFIIQAKNLRALKTLFIDVADEANTSIQKLPAILEEVINNRVHDVFTYYKRVDFDLDKPNIQPVIQKAQTSNEDRTEVVKRYLKGFYGTKLNLKISNKFFRKKPLHYLDYFAERYDVVFDDTSL